MVPVVLVGPAVAPKIVAYFGENTHLVFVSSYSKWMTSLVAVEPAALWRAQFFKRQSLPQQ